MGMSAQAPVNAGTAAFPRVFLFSPQINACVFKYAQVCVCKGNLDASRLAAQVLMMLRCSMQGLAHEATNQWY